MALPTTTMSMEYPPQSGIFRTMYQGGGEYVTNGTSVILGTISATKDFYVTSIDISVYNSANTYASFYINSDEVFRFDVSSAKSQNIDFTPFALRINGSNTNTAYVDVSGAVTAGMSVIIKGYYD